MSDRDDHTGSVVIQGTVTITGSVTITGTVTITGNVNVTNTVINIQGVAGGTAVSISGAVTITSGTVSISGTVNITGPVTITSGNINVATAGGTNLIIDKLTQGAVNFIAATIIQACVDYSATPAGWSRAKSAIGFFFPRGMRGLPRYIQIKIRNTHPSSAQNAVFRLGFQPNLNSYLYTNTTSIPANTTIDATLWNYDWSPTLSFWNYDSMCCFVDISISGANIEIAFDSGPYQNVGIWVTETPPTSPSTWVFESYDSIVTGYYNPFMRINRQAAGVGDIPITGTVTNIQIPNVSAAMVPFIDHTIAAGGTWTVLDISGAGTLGFIALRISDIAGVGGYVKFHIWIDGTDVLGTGYIDDWTTLLPSDSAAAATGLRYAAGVPVAWYSPGGANSDRVYIFKLDWEFLRALKIEVENTSVSTITANVGYKYNLLW